MLKSLNWACMNININILRANRQHILIAYRYVRFYKGRDNNNEDRSSLLANLLGCSKEHGLEILKHQMGLSTLDSDRIQKAADMLKSFYISKEDILNHPSVLTLAPATIEHRAMILYEGGFEEINARLLVRFLSLLQMRISLIKTCGYISAHTDVVRSFISHLDYVPPKLAQLILQQAHRWDEKTLLYIHETVLKHFLTWRLEMMPGEVDSVIKIYFRIQHKSFQHLCSTLDFLENEIGFSKEKIRRNGFLMHSHPYNIINTLQNIKTLGGIDIKTVLLKNPKILLIPTSTVIRTSKYLKEYGISDEAVQHCLEVFTLCSENVQFRLSELHNIPEFRALLTHPRIVRLVHYQHRAKLRVANLRKLRMRCVSLNVLSSSDTLFQQYIRNGEHCTGGVDTLFVLACKLGASVTSLRQTLNQHPFWRHVPLISILDTLDCLLALGYTHSEVLCNIHILLYPRIQVEQELLQLSEREELIADRLLAPTVLTGNQRLALCLYYIERQYHFTGDGIWAIQSDPDIDSPILMSEATSHHPVEIFD